MSEHAKWLRDLGAFMHANGHPFDGDELEEVAAGIEQSATKLEAREAEIVRLKDERKILAKGIMTTLGSTADWAEITQAYRKHKINGPFVPTLPLL